MKNIHLFEKMNIVFSDIGGRSSQEDETLYYDTDKYGIYGVFDGHFGTECAKFLAKYIPDMISSIDFSIDRSNDIIDEIRNRSQMIDREILRRNIQSGSTATVIILDKIKKNIFLLHIGDSRAVEIINGKFIQLTKDDIWTSQMALEKSSNDVVVLGTHVWIQDPKRPSYSMSLEISKSFGDLSFKRLNNPKITTDIVDGTPDVIYLGKYGETQREFLLYTDGFYNLNLDCIIEKSLKNRSVKDALNDIFRTIYPTVKSSSDNISVLYISI